MNIRLLLMSTCIVIGLIIGIVLFKKSSKPTARYRVAIVVPAAHAALEEIEQGFKETLNKELDEANVDTTGIDMSVAYDVFNAQGDRTLLRQQAEQVVDGNYDLICTIATQPSLLIKELLLKRGHETPVVACAVDDPVGIGLVASMESSGNMVVAVTSHDDMRKQLDAIHTVKPQIKKMLLVYHPATVMQKYARQVASITTGMGIELTRIEIMNTHEIMAKVSPVIQGNDAVLVLTDNVVVAGIEALVNICNKTGITLCASDLNSGYKGAAIALGVTEYSYGSFGAQQARLILLDNKRPTDIPSHVVDDFKLLINTHTMQQQGLTLDTAQIDLLREQFQLIMYGAS